MNNILYFGTHIHISVQTYGECIMYYCIVLYLLYCIITTLSPTVCLGGGDLILTGPLLQGFFFFFFFLGGGGGGRGGGDYHWVGWGCV